VIALDDDVVGDASLADLPHAGHPCHRLSDITGRAFAQHGGLERRRGQGGLDLHRVPEGGDRELDLDPGGGGFGDADSGRRCRVKALKNENVYRRSDERILGDGEFVGSVLAAAQEAMEKHYSLRARGYDLERIALRVSEVLETEPGAVWRKGRYRQAVEARSLFCYWAVRELGAPMSVLARKLGISIPAVSKSVDRGQAISKATGCSLLTS